MQHVSCRYVVVHPTRLTRFKPAAVLIDESPELYRTFRRQLLQKPGGFGMAVEPRGLPLIRLTWQPVGQTAGALILPPFVYHPPRREPAMISLLLNGVESPEDLSALAAKFPLEKKHWDDLLECEKPVAFTLVFEAGRLRDPATTTVINSFANSFFSLFGTNTVEEPLMGS